MKARADRAELLVEAAELLAADLRLEEPRVILTGDEKTVVLLDREVAEPDLELVGTEWEIQGFEDASAVGFGAWPETILRFAPDATVAIDARCPVTSVEHGVEGMSLTFSNVAHEFDACPSELNTFVMIATAVLSDGSTAFELDGNQLRLSRGNVGLRLSGAVDLDFRRLGISHTETLDSNSRRGRHPLPWLRTTSLALCWYVHACSMVVRSCGARDVGRLHGRGSLRHHFGAV